MSLFYFNQVAKLVFFLSLSKKIFLYLCGNLSFPPKLLNFYAKLIS